MPYQIGLGKSHPALMKGEFVPNIMLLRGLLRIVALLSSMNVTYSAPPEQAKH
jgi:hypothetical protein